MPVREKGASTDLEMSPAGKSVKPTGIMIRLLLAVLLAGIPLGWGMPPGGPGPGLFSAGEAQAQEDEEDSLTTPMIDLEKAGLFQESEEAIQGRTIRGQTILDAPSFRVLRRKIWLDYYPCADCHADEPVNPKERKLVDEHEDIVLEHGQGRFWCLTCHGTPQKNALTSLKGKPIDFDYAFVLCGQCHFQRQKDWYFGGHGKRAGAFPAPREIPATRDELLVEEREKIGRWGKARGCCCPARPATTPIPRPSSRTGPVRRRWCAKGWSRGCTGRTVIPRSG